MGKIRKLWFVGIGIAIVAITVIIYHNYIDIDVKEGNMIYASKLDGDEWFMDPNNLDKDKRFDSDAELTKNPDGSWSVDSNEQIRLKIWTKDSGNFRQQEGMDTYNHNVIKTRGYWYKPSDWKNVEMTGYFKLKEYVEDEYSIFSRSIWHNRNQSGCGGSDYKVQLHFDGTISSQKEEWHVYYTDQPKKWPVEPKRKDVGIGNLTDRWIGLKIIVYNTVENRSNYPTIEMWIDENNNDTWRKVYEYMDVGGWGSTMDKCGGASDQLITWGSPVATFRWDETDNVDFRSLSIREIEPPP